MVSWLPTAAKITEVRTRGCPRGKIHLSLIFGLLSVFSHLPPSDTIHRSQKIDVVCLALPSHCVAWKILHDLSESHSDVPILENEDTSGLPVHPRR